MFNLILLLTVFILGVVVQNPVAAEQLKCWTCSSDLFACKDELVANATTDPRIFTTCTADGDVCKTQIRKIGDTMLISRGCAAKSECEDANKSVFCETCSTSGCNSKGCNDTTCNINNKNSINNNNQNTKNNKNGSSALGTSVALIIVSLGFLYYK